MAKRSIRLLVTLGVLVVLLGAYAVVKAMPKAKPSTSTSVRIADIKQPDITKIQIKKGEKTLVLDRKGNAFEPVTPYPMRIDSSAVQRILYNVTSVFVQRVVQSSKLTAADLSKYGLENPTAVTTVDLKSGAPVVYTIGGTTPSNDGYYFQKSGDPKVYALDNYSAQSMMLGLTDLRDHSLPTINTQKLTYFELRNGKQHIVIQQPPAGFKTEEATFSNLVMTSPYPNIHPVATDKLGTLLKSIPSFTVDKFVNDHPTNLAQYGLDPVRTELVMKDDKNALDLEFGNKAPGGGYYARLVGDPGVFTVNSDLSFLNSTTAFDLVDKFALIVNIDKVDQMRMVTPNKTYTAELTRTGTGKNIKTAYTFDGKNVDEKFFKSFYQIAIGILYDAENPSPRPGKADVTISYTLNTPGKPTLSVDFVPFNQDFYQVYRNNVSEFVVSRSQIQGVIQAAQALAQNKNPSPGN